jgi:hypothetical protein
MRTEINVTRLGTILHDTINAYRLNDPFTHDILLLMFLTGLRINEVLEVSRWRRLSIDYFVCYLEKGDEKRAIEERLIPASLIPYYEKGEDNPVYTYSALLWRINKATPIITVNGDVRRSSAHLFRYYFIKDLYERGVTPTEIREIICHKSQGSTNQYIFDRLFLHS